MHIEKKMNIFTVSLLRPDTDLSHCVALCGIVWHCVTLCGIVWHCVAFDSRSFLHLFCIFSAFFLQDLGFIFLYELLTGTINIKVGFDDDSFNWGSIFIRMLAPEDTQVREINYILNRNSYIQ